MFRQRIVEYKRCLFTIIFMATVIVLIINLMSLDNGKSKQFIMAGLSTKDIFDRNLSLCQKLKIPEETFVEVFQPVGYKTDIHVYSAFMRESKIRIVGAKLLNRNQSVFCQVWYGGKETILSVVKADMVDIKDHHWFKYTSYMFDCAVQHSSMPFAVSLVPEECVEPMNRLKVINDKPNVLANFTICLQPFFFTNKKSKIEFKIIEFIELAKILGANKFVVYVCNTTREIGEVLKYYEKQNTIDILQWNLPKEVFPNIHVRGQISAENDCLYRYEKHSKYLVYIDIDEFIIPRQHLTWNDMMNDLPKDFGEYNFRHTLFRTNWPITNISYTKKNVALNYNVQSFLRLSRDKEANPHRKRSKCIINPKFVDIMGIHYAWKFKNTSTKRFHVNNSTALLHHYRYWTGKIETMPHVVDTEILKYEDGFFKNVERVRKDLLD